MSVPVDSTSNTSKRQKILTIAIPLVVVALIVFSLYFIHSTHYEWTDDATITTSLTEMSPRVPGQVAHVYIQDNQEVKEGDVLVELDPLVYQASVRQGEATHQNALAAEKEAKINVQLTTQTSKAGVLQESAGINSARHGVRSAELQAAEAAAELQETRSQLKAAEADAQLANSDLERYRALFEKDEVSRQQLDQAIDTSRRSNANVRAASDRVQTAFGRLRETISKTQEARSQVGEAVGRYEKVDVVGEQIATSQAQLESAKAQVKQTESALQTARLNLLYTKIVAPISGRITNKNVNPGNYVQTGQVLFAIVPQEVWVTANFKETQLTHMRPGQPVTIKVDAYPHKVFKGHVDSIQSGTGSAFSLLPPENATGNYVKVVQRVPVKIVFDEPNDPNYQLSPGMSVIPEVRIR